MLNLCAFMVQQVTKLARQATAEVTVTLLARPLLIILSCTSGFRDCDVLIELFFLLSSELAEWLRHGAVLPCEDRF